MSSKKAQLVFVPIPAIGHLVSTIEFAKLLINYDHRLHITILLINTPNRSINNINLALSERVRVINLPDSQAPSTDSNITTVVENQKPLVKETVSNLTSSNDSPRLVGFVVDTFCTAMADVAREFGVPYFVFFTSGVALLGLVIHLNAPREGEDSDTELAIPSFVNPVPVACFPCVLQKEEAVLWARRHLEADGIIVNSFEELESHAVHSFSCGGPHIYPVGPLLKLEDKENCHSAGIIKWLDEQPPCSVVFLCFGSMGSFEVDQVREIARALEASGFRFLWSLRKPPPKGSMGMPTDYTVSELVEVLPDGFLDRTAKIGRVIGWAPQAQVLARRATGGFVSHCGWNSVLESIYYGVPILTWPLYAEQQTNAFQIVSELKIGVEITLDFKVGSKKVLTAEKIERGIRDVMEKDGEVRQRVKEMSDKSRKTTMEGGHSYSYLGRLVDYIMNHV